MSKIVVFTADLSFAVRKGIVAIDVRFASIEWLIVRHRPIKPFGQLLRNQFRNLRKNGWRWVGYQTAEILRMAWTRLAPGRVASPTDGPGGAFDLDRLIARPNVKLLDTTDIHGKAALAQIRAFAPDLGLSLAAPILKPSLFELPRLGTINLHKGKLPDYRGMPPAFWELWNDEKEVGCTVHRVNAGLDKGEVVVRSTVPVQRYSTVKGLQLMLDELGIELMRDAVEQILGGTAQYLPQPSGGKTNTKPTLAQIAALNHKLRECLPPRSNPLRTLGKTGYLIASLYLGRLRLALSSRNPTVTVILYHRVTDELRDSLTTGVERFDRQMALIRKHCHALSIEDILHDRYPRRPRKPLVCVTFDDGYRDNYLAAAPLLLRHRVPAAFFVSTGLIGTGRGFAHDRGKVPIPLANMTWDDLRHMRRDGFPIGSHTVNHIDCAAESTATVDTELRHRWPRCVPSWVSPT